MKILCGMILLLGAGVAAGQDDNTVSSDSIIDALVGDKRTRAILVKDRKQDPAGMSIDLTIEFEFDSSQLTEQSQTQLVQLQAALANELMQPYAFEIVGHTDGKGDDEYNKRLSLARASTVRKFLMDRGIERERLLIDGKGEGELLYPHLPDDGRNRRVEITNLGATKNEP